MDAKVPVPASRRVDLAAPATLSGDDTRGSGPYGGDLTVDVVRRLAVVLLGLRGLTTGVASAYPL